MVVVVDIEKDVLKYFSFERKTGNQSKEDQMQVFEGK